MARANGAPRLDRRGRGQATVELAMVLPLVLVLVLFLAQVGLVLKDQLSVVHAAREGARAAAVDPREQVARQAVLQAATLDPQRVTVALQIRDTNPPTVTVTVTYVSVTDMPLIGGALRNVVFTESVTMRREGSPDP